MSVQAHRASSPVAIRSFQRSDQSECVKIFIDGIEEFFKVLYLAVLKTVSRYSVIATALAAFAAILWSMWMLAVGSVVVFSLVVYPFAKLHQAGYFRLRKSALEKELNDIEKSYMSRDDCHMWVAECNGRVVGMVGLMRTESHEPRVAELLRLYVVRSCRGMGISKKLLNELTAYAKRQGIDKILLRTTSTQIPAIRLYKKHGFGLVKEINIIGAIANQVFNMQL